MGDGTFCAYVTNQIKHLFKMNYGNMTSSTVRITIPKIELEQTGDLVKQNNRNSKHKQARTKKEATNNNKQNQNQHKHLQAGNNKTATNNNKTTTKTTNN